MAYAQAQGAQRCALAACPMSTAEGHCLFVHANAYAPADWADVQGRAEAIRSLARDRPALDLLRPRARPDAVSPHGTGKAGDFTPIPGVPIPLSPQRRRLATPGSSGQPRDGNPAACYAIFDTASATLTFHRVADDVDGAAAKLRAAGRPEALTQRLIHRR